MVRNVGTTNYSLGDIQRMLRLVEKVLPLGKGEWERLAASFNASKPRGAPERDYESLRRKFKQLYSTRKPTGVATMPPHVQKAKEAKQAIHDKANVIELDDEAVGDNEEQRFVEPDFSIDTEPDATFYQADDQEILNAAATMYHPGSIHSEMTASDESVAEVSTEPIRGNFQGLLAATFVEGVEDSMQTACPAQQRATSSTRRQGSGGLQPPRKTTSNDEAAVTKQKCPDSSGAARSRNEIEAAKYPDLQRHSNRLGGGDLATFRDSVGAKRASEDDDDEHEASFAKTKRVRALKATSALKAKLDGLESSASSTRNNILETILLMREETERKAEARREEEEQRRRDELAVMEARRLAEKAEAEERRRVDRQDMEERARRDREEARARTQELVMLLGALTKKE
ncbi:hypothetical protein DVH05_016097 [Phytophthora capsici]|nr:hypothetical protein DVH05_016097 [Phytophthora capsici]